MPLVWHERCGRQPQGRILPARTTCALMAAGSWNGTVLLRPLSQVFQADTECLPGLLKCVSHT